MPARPRWIALVAGSVWFLTLCLGLATAWVTPGFLGTVSKPSGESYTPDEILFGSAALFVFAVIAVGYASVGALLVGRRGAGRIAVLLLTGGLLFALTPFAVVVGSSIGRNVSHSGIAGLLLLVGSLGIGPMYITILPGLAIVFPDGRLPSERWRWPVVLAIGVIGAGASILLVRPGDLQKVFGAVPSGAVPNPLGLDALPSAIGVLADPSIAIGILAFTVLGIVAVIVRYRRGNAVERQQQRWFAAAVLVGAVPLSLGVLPWIRGPATLIVAILGLALVPLAVGVAVTRYRLYGDRPPYRPHARVRPSHGFAGRSLWGNCGPPPAPLRGGYGKSIRCCRDYFDVILASVFTPLRKWLEAIVDRRFKPGSVGHGQDANLATQGSESDWETRMAAVALQVVRTELEARGVHEPAQSINVPSASTTITGPALD